ncbi:MAG: hypothetical protein ACOC8M_00640 [Guyparkeria sp.]|uniref:hypothetical protein n=1 Tax=Guyparkeria sp. TaxID=2035736 RepID=UPI00397CAEBE
MGKSQAIRLLGAGLVCLGLVFSGPVRAAFQPFVEGKPIESSMEDAVASVSEQLAAEGFDVAGDYAPTEGVHVFVVTSDALLATAARSDRGGYGAVLSVALEQDGESVRVSYQDPRYVAHGYRLEDDNEPVFQAIAGALGATGYFGAEPISEANLRTYQYGFGLETFGDAVDLGELGSFARAQEQIAERATGGDLGTELVYRVRIPGKDQVVFGVALKSDNANANGAALVEAVDLEAPRAYAFLPYPILLDGSSAETLNLRFRMALFFPDLPMMGGDASFFKLRSAPDAINALLLDVVDGKVHSDEGSSGGFGSF